MDDLPRASVPPEAWWVHGPIFKSNITNDLTSRIQKLKLLSLESQKKPFTVESDEEIDEDEEEVIKGPNNICKTSNSSSSVEAKWPTNQSECQNSSPTHLSNHQNPIYLPSMYVNNYFMIEKKKCTVPVKISPDEAIKALTALTTYNELQTRTSQSDEPICKKRKFDEDEVNTLGFYLVSDSDDDDAYSMHSLTHQDLKSASSEDESSKRNSKFTKYNAEQLKNSTANMNNKIPQTRITQGEEPYVVKRTSSVEVFPPQYAIRKASSHEVATLPHLNGKVPDFENREFVCYDLSFLAK